MGDAQNARDMGMGMPQTRGCPKRCDSAPPREGEKPRERGWGSLWTVCKQNGGRHVVFGRRSSFSLLVDPDCESVITLLIVIARKQQLARFVNQIVKLTV